MIFQYTQVVSHMERGAMAYASPRLARFGSIRDVTSASLITGGPKSSQTAENAPGIGTTRKP